MAGLPGQLTKKLSLRRKEDELRRLIARGANRVKLLKAALAVRDGRISGLRAVQNHNPESSAKERAIYVKHEAKIAALRRLTAEEVLAEYVP